MLRLLLITPLFLTALASQSASVTQINRYATVDNKPLAAQINPLLAVQQMHFPLQVHTIGEAVEWWLQYSGFKLVSKDKQSKNLQEIFSQPLPQIDRNLGPLSVKDGLEVLVGQQFFKLVADPLKRQVNFQLKPLKG